jgi:phosphatidylglycerol---prolipoprotein diacylglyceryl transferase
LEGFVLFVVLRVLTDYRLKLKALRFVAGSFVVGYGLSRTVAEFFREPEMQLGYSVGGWMTMGMVLSLPILLAAFGQWLQ